MKKRIIGIIAVAALVAISMVSLVGCGPKLADWEYIEDRGKFIVGVTPYAPLSIVADDGKTVTGGFDTDLAKAVGEKLGLDVKFVVITWDMKIIDLNGYSIDVVWNGMTIDDELKKKMNISEPYMNNNQVVIVQKANEDWVESDLVGLEIGVESGSAGDKAATAKFADSDIKGATAQVDVFLELLSGNIGAGVVDSILASTLINAEGSAYSGKIVANDNFEFAAEEFGIGFRKGDDVFMGKVWEAIEELKADGTMLEIATKYNLQDVVIFD